MIRFKVLICCLLTCSSLALSKTGFENRPILNNVHVPTGYTLNKGEFTVGIGPIAFGISDKVQIGTNALSFILGSPNVNGRVNVYQTNEHSVSVGLGVGQVSTQVFNNDASFTSWYPFVAYSRPLSETTNLHAGINLSIFTSDDDVGDAEPLESWRGTSMDVGVEYSYSNRTKFLGEGGYDFTFSGPRLSGAVLWGWKTFRLKLGVAFYDPEGVSNAFFSPIIGFWWRFGGL
jgi:hypothetical protein